MLQSNCVPTPVNLWKKENCLSTSFRLSWSAAILGFLSNDASAAFHAVIACAFCASMHGPGASSFVCWPFVSPNTYDGNILTEIVQWLAGHTSSGTPLQTRSRTRTKKSARSS